MPRSVNAVASRARRKKVMKLAKGFFGRRKNVWTVAKNAVQKAMQYAYRGRKEKKRKEISEAYGLPVSMQVQDFTECRTRSLWGKLKQTESNLIVKFLRI